MESPGGACPERLTGDFARERIAAAVEASMGRCGRVDSYGAVSNR